MICKKAAQYVSFRLTNDYKLTDPPFFPFLLILFQYVFYICYRKYAFTQRGNSFFYWS